MSDETPRERYARSALVGLLAAYRTRPRDVRGLASTAFYIADAMIAAESAPYCTYCGSSSDLIGATKGGVLVHLCADCADAENERNVGWRG
jgi:hypothetical protein